MKAQVLTAASRLEFLEVPKPSPAADEVLLRIRACGICGSDIHGWDGSTGRRTPPLVMGHEAAGEVAAVGDGVAGWREGDRVTFDSTIFCGHCVYCRAGRSNLCLSRRVVGVAPAEYKQHGAFAEYLALPARGLHRLPDALDFPTAAFAEPTAVAIHAVHQAGHVARSNVVVFGAGMIGLLVIQALRWAGAEVVIAVDLSPERLALARQLGATHTVNSSVVDAVAEIQALTDGLGADVCLEVVGITATLNLALHALRRGGRCVLVGNLAPSTKDFPLQLVVTRELTLVGSCAATGEYAISLDLLARGVIQTSPLTSAVAPLSDAARWFEHLRGPEAHRFLKVILVP